MQIIGGELRGKKLAPLRGTAIRPTADRTREAIFNIIAAKVPGANALGGRRLKNRRHTAISGWIGWVTHQNIFRSSSSSTYLKTDKPMNRRKQDLPAVTRLEPLSGAS